MTCLGIIKVAGIISFVGGDIPEDISTPKDSLIEAFLNTIIVLVGGDLRSING